MAQHDYNIANQSGQAFRADLNNALAAIVSGNSGASAPSTTFAYQYWVDTSTTPATLKQRNSANNAWLTIGQLDTANLGLIPAGAASIVNADVNASAGIVASKLSFTQAGTGATARTVENKLRDVVSVKDFGAVGNGVADDTAAIQAAENASGYLYWPAGTYVISSTITLGHSKDRKWVGEGFNSQEIGTYTHGTIIKWAGATNGLMFDGRIAGGQNVSGFALHDIRIDGAGVASRGLAFASNTAHGQHHYWQNVNVTGMATNGTDAAVDFYSATLAYSIVDSEFHGCVISGGAVGLRIAGQQLNFFGGSIGASATGTLVSLQANSHPKFFGTGFYGGDVVLGVEGTIGIDGLECYGCWNEGNKRLFGRLGATFSPVIGALRVIFSGQRSSCLSSGTQVIDTTGLQTNIVWEGGYNDNVGLAGALIDTGSSMTVVQLQAGAFAYSGSGKVIEYGSSGVIRRLGSGISENIDFIAGKGLTGLNSVSARKNLISLNSDDLVVLGETTALTKLATGASGDFPTAAAKYDGIVGVNQTLGQLVFYSNGVRYRVTGTAY